MDGRSFGYFFGRLSARLVLIVGVFFLARRFPKRVFLSKTPPIKEVEYA